MQQTDDLTLRRKRRALQLLGLACFGAGFLNFIQASYPLNEWAWDVIWFLYIILIEIVSEPLYKGTKFIKRLALGGLLIAFALALFWGLMKLSNAYGITPAYLTPVPFFVIGIVFFVWSMFIHLDDLSQ